MRNKYSRGKRNKITPGQRTFFPKNWPNDQEKELGRKMIEDIRSKMGWNKQDDAEA